MSMALTCEIVPVSSEEPSAEAVLSSRRRLGGAVLLSSDLGPESGSVAFSE
jgi:hypothetical protein